MRIPVFLSSRQCKVPSNLFRNNKGAYHCSDELASHTFVVRMQRMPHTEDHRDVLFSSDPQLATS